MLSITTKDGSLITLSANVLEQITYQNSDLEFLKVISSETLADNIPRISSSADIDILAIFGTLWKENEWFFLSSFRFITIVEGENLHGFRSSSLNHKSFTDK